VSHAQIGFAYARVALNFTERASGDDLAEAKHVDNRGHVDLKADLMELFYETLGDEYVPTLEAIKAWLDDPATGRDPDLNLSRQVVPRLYGEVNQGRIPCVVRAFQPHEDWTMHAYHLYYPGTGRFQNIVPKREG